MITFDPLWETLRRKKISQYMLIKEHGVSTGTLDALRKNRSITMNTLNDLCNLLQCDVSDIIQYRPDDE
jgi:DNA-binding Xre family transcriptional regulator